MQYVALLRGVNVGGKNKVVMADLKLALSDAGLSDVRTYINSGNVLFHSDEIDAPRLALLCEDTIEKQFGFPVECAVFSAIAYKKAINDAPKWWGTGDEHMRSDVLFMLRRGTTEAVINKIGPVNKETERIASGDAMIFWTADMRHYGKARLPRIMGTDEYRSFSMRSSTTARKLYALLEEE